MADKKLLVILGFLVSGCTSNFYFEKNTAFDNKIWSISNPVEYEVNFTDSLQKYQVFIDIRHSAEYPYRNFWVFLKTETPNGLVSRDTLELILSDKRGKWLGKTASGNIISHHILIAKDKIFNTPGKYIFSFENALREENNQAYIQSIGMSIEESDE